MKSLLLALALLVPAVSMAAGTAFSLEQMTSQAAPPTPDKSTPAKSVQAHRPLIEVTILPAKGGVTQPILDFGNGKAAISADRLSLRHSVYLDRPIESPNVIVCYARACEDSGSIR